MIRILFVISTLDRSGAEKQLSLLATRLPRDEFDVHVVALTRGGPYATVLKEQQVPLAILHKRWKFDPVALSKLRRLVADLKPDIVHTWLFTANAYGRLVAGRKPRPRLIISERCVDVWKSGWQRWVDRRQIARTARLIGNSQSVAEFYRNQGFPSERIAVIPNGVEIPELPPIDRGRLLGELDLPPEARIVGYVGRIARQKRLRDLVWALELVRHVNPNIYFLIVGDGPERADVRQFAHDTGCAPNIRFLGHRDDLNMVWRLMEVFWLASDFEGQSNSIMEAMAAGLPVVCSDIPPNRELIVDGETGYLVQVGDSVGFSQFAERLLADPELARRMGSAGRARMQAEFGIDRMVQTHIDVYRSVLVETA